MEDLLGDQPQAFEKLQHFIEQENSRVFRLIGVAGSGKTTIITKLVMNLLKTKKNINKIYFLSSTNKAVSVLREKSNYLDNENVQFLTIDKFLNCIERIDEYGNTYFCPKGLRSVYINKTNFYIDDTNDPKVLNTIKKDKDIFRNPNKYCTRNFLNFIKEDDLVIIDECSMLNNQKWKFIKSLCACKIICTGDILQLQPIDKENVNQDCTVFTEEVDDEFDFEMTTILRTDDSKINKLYEVTRDMIDKHLSYSEVYAILKKLDIDKTGMKETLINKIKQYLKENKDFTVLSYKNYSVDEFSKIIYECLDDTKVRKYGYFLNTKYIMKTHYNQSLTNNTGFVILDVIKDSDNEYTLKILSENKEEIDLVVYDKDLHDKKTSTITSNIDTLKKYPFLRSESEKNKLKKFAENIVNNNKSILSSYSNIIEGAMIKLKQDLRSCILKNDEIFSLSYSLTIHKSQGSSFENCIINLRDIYDTKPITLSMKARLLYVALSRSVNEVMFYV